MNASLYPLNVFNATSESPDAQSPATGHRQSVNITIPSTTTDNPPVKISGPALIYLVYSSKYKQEASGLIMSCAGRIKLNP